MTALNPSVAAAVMSLFNGVTSEKDRSSSGTKLCVPALRENGRFFHERGAGIFNVSRSAYEVRAGIGSWARDQSLTDLAAYFQTLCLYVVPRCRQLMNASTSSNVTRRRSLNRDVRCGMPTSNKHRCGYVKLRLH